MSRRKVAPKRSILPDPLFKSELLAKFINRVMKKGKKAVAEKIVYASLKNAVERYNFKEDEENKELFIFKEALKAVQPSVEVRSRRIGGATYQVPVEVSSKRKLALSMRWIVEASKKRSEKTMILKLANEFLDAIKGKGGAVKKRETAYSMAKANQAFAHIRW